MMQKNDYKITKGPSLQPGGTPIHWQFLQDYTAWLRNMASLMISEIISLKLIQLLSYINVSVHKMCNTLACNALFVQLVISDYIRRSQQMHSQQNSTEAMERKNYVHWTIGFKCIILDPVRKQNLWALHPCQLYEEIYI